MAATEIRHALLKKEKEAKNYVSKKRTLWSHYFEGNVDIPEICIESINLCCPNEQTGCIRLHAKQAWHWQVLHNNEWYNFITSQSERLERAYQNVDTDEVTIRALDPSRLGRHGQELIKLLGTNHWRADFNFMKLRNTDFSVSFHIRRLSTPSSIVDKSIYASEYRWFFLQNESWVEFAQAFEEEKEGDVVPIPTQSQTTSRTIEKQYQKSRGASMYVNVLNGKYRLNFNKMHLINKKLRKVIPVRRRPRNSDIRYPTIWSHHIQGDIDIAEICMDAVDEVCVHENGCGKLHAKDSWHWQVLHNDIWHNLPKTQCRVLERAYLEVWKDDVEIPAIDPTKMGKLGVAMTSILGTTKWLAQFDSLTLTKLNPEGTVLRIRRLSTPSDVTSSCKTTTKFVWFYKNEHDMWIEFGCLNYLEDSMVISQTSSYETEKSFVSKKWDTMEVNIRGDIFELEFSFMTLRNCCTEEEMVVRRRPQCARSNQIFSRMPGVVTLSTISREYEEVRAKLLLSIKQPEILKIKRIQNPDLWKTFLKRQKELSDIYGNDEVLNIHTLFHWVRKEFLEDIRLNNFTWNHQCSEVKENSEKGMCFFRSAEFLHKACSSPLLKDHRLLVSLVLVGKMKGPDSESTDEKCFTKVDNSYLPTKFVKHDQRDYYPAYFIKL